jgi:hypothetical protein
VTSLVGWQLHLVSKRYPKSNFTINNPGCFPYLVPVRRSGIVDHHVQLAELVVRELDQLLPILFLRNIGSHELTLEFVCCLLADFLDEVCDDNAGALLDELGRDALAETAATACHDCDLVLELALGHGC